MCGIAGYVRQREKEESATTILRMIRAQAHRGPDDEGIALIDASSGRAMDLSTARTMHGVQRIGHADQGASMAHDVALGHCRFSIIDLSPGGHQPFWSADRGLCVTFNGEIYNYVELRAELERLGHAFRTRSDTEVLVEAYREWGTECFGKFVGFWAVALYDARRHSVLLGRDRLGKAPMYVARHDGRLLWASEIKSILEVTGRSAFAIREQAIADYAAHSLRDVGHKTFYDGIETFPNASFAWIESEFRPRRFWEIPQRRMSEREMSIPHAVGEFRRRLADAVAVRLRADVPVGFELSGGLDSSTLVAAAAMQGRRVHAYTVSFPGTEADEEPYARQVHERYPELVEYTVLNPHQEDFWEQADEYIATMGEPFHAPNMISNREIWRDMSQRGIRVSINGAAGDESWAGYFNDYYEPFLRRLARSGQWGQLLRNCRMFGERPHALWSKTVLRRLATAFSPVNGNHGDGAYMTSSPGSRAFALADRDNPLARLGRRWGKPHPTRDIERLMLDFMGDWRMNHWLRVVNQSYMSVPTEVRCPFLDHRLVEFACSLPLTYLIRDGWLKWLVRTAMADHLPAGVVWRKRKMGFPFPYVQWAIASRERFFGSVGRFDCPYVDMTRLREVYDRLARSNPLFLWRVMCLCLWWKRCVLGENLR